MRLWLDRHRRFRGQLSAYIDGELDAPAAERLERHLAECDRCRAELLQLRATVAALREMPEADPPRSFTLSPERAAAPRPALPTVSPLALGMRLAAAGVAAALVAVVLVDVGDIGGNGAGDGDATPQTVSEQQADEDAMEATDGAAGGAEEPAPEATPGGAATGTDTTEPDAGETPAGGAGGAEGGAPVAEPGPAETPAAPTEEDSEFGLRSGIADETPAAEPEEAAEAADAAAAGDGGIDALTAAEIGLAAALGVFVAGSLALAYAGRKR